MKNGVHETTEYLELFLRNLLLDEKNELHNRSMHISGKFAEVDIESEKVDIESEEVDIERTKVDIRKTTQNKFADRYITKSGRGIYNFFALLKCYNLSAYPPHVYKVKRSVRQ